MRHFRFAHALAILALLAASGCERAAPEPVVFHWWAGRPAPKFDPDGPPDALRAALERLLTRPLVSLDSLGRPVPDAAGAIEVSEDGLTYRFRLRPGLRFSDGSPCGADDYRRALVAGLGRDDHGTRAWLLAAVRGVEAVRPRRPPPVVAVSAPDSGTVQVELARADTTLLQKLAVPGTSAAWKDREPSESWQGAMGNGPYRVLRSGHRELVLLRRSGTGPDTVEIRFAIGAARARAALRGGGVDLLWPVPPSLLDQPLPAAFESRTRAARPERRLTLVLRSDVPPTTRIAARRALAHGVARAEIPRRVGAGARELGEWLPGAGPASLPGFDRAEIRGWLERGKLGRSIRVRLAYDADGAGAAIARGLEGEWARSDLSAELRPLRGDEFTREALLGQSQALLVEEQGLFEGPIGVLAAAVLPIRGPAVGAFRTGWRTREFDPWLVPRRPPPAFPSELARRRLEEETVLLPLCGLDWLWVERKGGPGVGFHPRFGPFPAGSVPPGGPTR